MAYPIIAVPAYPSLRDPEVIESRQAYIDALVAAGGTPLLLPPTRDAASARRMLAACRGLVLIGGGDIEARQYRMPDSGKLTYVSPERDCIELQYIRWALADGLPVLAICRGIQVLNVAAGGTLIQDIPSELSSSIHASSDDAAHTVEVAPNSLLARCVGCTGTLSVNSRHHQAVQRVAEGFRITARAADGVIEAIELSDAPFVLGVQWHPENLAPRQPAAAGIFSAFTAACG